MSLVFTRFFKFILKFFYLFPIKKNTVLYMSFEGSAYTCNPKYVFNFLNSFKDLTHVWVLNSTGFVPPLLLNSKNVIIVKYKSLKYFYYMLTSRIVVTNNISVSYIPFRKKQTVKQTVFGTWHGGGAYKKVGYHINNSDSQKKLLSALSSNMDYMVSSCKEFSSVMEDAYFISKEKFISSGMPRNDILINNDDLLKKEINDNIREIYNINKNKKIAIYAPTFRGNLNSPVLELEKTYNLDISNLKKSLEKKFLGEFVILFRAHYYLSSLNLFNNVVDVSSYPDMQELLLISDVLITDYSSSIWDFSFTNKPCFIFASDKNDYIDNRDFYTPMAEWPFSVATTNKELEDNIYNFDYNKYKVNIFNHHKQLGSYEKGHASKIIGNKIINIINEK